METLLPKSIIDPMREMLSVIKKDKQAEVEFKVLIGQIETKDVSDRIVKAIELLSNGVAVEQHYATFTYPDGLRVVVAGPENIHKVCTSSSFRGVPLNVEKKRKYYDVNPRKGPDMIEIPDLDTRLTLRHEEQLRKDFSGKPMDPNSHVRIIHRKSWTTADKLFRIDFSMVKSKKREHTVFSEVLKQPIKYELEVEVIDRNADELLKPMLSVLEKLVAAYQQSPFVLLSSDIQRYKIEFGKMNTTFINPVTMERKHGRMDNPHNILKGYTVTVKADGQRCFMVVMRDRRVVLITPAMQISWTGLTANDDKHFGDILDGEYLQDKNLFCVFDIYSYHGKDVRSLPLMITDEETLKNPLKSRLGCIHAFVDKDLKSDFSTLISTPPFSVQAKEFRAGDGVVMQESIQKILDTDYGYPTDGLIFTPRGSPVAPLEDRKGKTWLRVYKWKPSDQNSIDFLVRFSPGESFDPVLNSRILKGILYVSRTPGNEILYPCETITGEYNPPKVPEDIRVKSESQNRVPSPFYPTIPRSTTAHNIMIPVNERGVPVDKTGTKIEDNTIIECAYDTETKRWSILRTRYDKTYSYRVKGEPQFGNDINVADNIWKSMHVPITTEMIRNIASNPPDDTFEDDLYYRDELGRKDRIWLDVAGFHNRIKESLYQSNIKKGDTLLELAVGRGGDIQKWIKTQPSKVVGIDISDSNLNAPRSGLCVRYIEKKRKDSKLPPGLFFKADMTQSLEEQEGHYLKIINGTEPAPTEYLQQFHGLNSFDAISCQFAIHYACESEESFRVFVGNLTKYGKGTFFGTCLDGQKVYSLLLNKESHVFRSNQGIFGEFKKDYQDNGWTEDFGKEIRVKLETFEQEQKEYLVPFEKVKEILASEGFELIEEKSFGDYYAGQNGITLGQEQQEFSFLHRSFSFRKGEKPKPAPEPVKEEEPVVEEKKIEEVKDEEGKIIKRKIVKIETPKEEEVEPILFNGSDESKGNFRMLSNDYVAPFQMDSIKFPTVEHAYEYAKAKAFGDEKMAALIVKTPSAKSVKALGKKISGFKEEEWEQKQDSVMKAAIKAKLSQHPEIRSVLSETKASPIGYANARDKYWGIGTSPEKDKAKTPSKWAGKNQLGKIMEELRTEFNSSSP